MVHQAVTVIQGWALNIILEDGGDFTNLFHTKYSQLLLGHLRHFQGNQDWGPQPTQDAGQWDPEGANDNNSITRANSTSSMAAGSPS